MTGAMTFSQVIGQLIERRDLPADTVQAVFDQLMAGELTPGQIGALLVLLKAKGESADEIATAARVMRSKSVKIDLPGDIVDTCGTGGDVKGTFNISTAAAIVAAGAGAAVVKHGNRSASGRSGSADVLEALGARLEVAPESEAEVLDAAGLCFLFARSFHPAMSHAAAVRRELGVPTIFNLIGPLTNPAGAKRQLVGVYAPHLCDLLAAALLQLGATRAWVVHGRDGLDELSTMSESTVAEVVGGKVRRFDVDAVKLGLPRAALADLQVSTPAESAQVLRSVLDGKKFPPRDIVLLNAGAALVVAGIAADLAAGIAKAAEAVDSGKAAQALHRLVEKTRAAK